MKRGEWLRAVARELREPTSHSGDQRLGREIDELLDVLNAAHAAITEPYAGDGPAAAAYALRRVLDEEVPE